MSTARSVIIKSNPNVKQKERKLKDEIDLFDLNKEQALLDQLGSQAKEVDKNMTDDLNDI